MTLTEMITTLENSGVCGGRITALRAPDGQIRPFATYSSIESVTDHDLDGFVGESRRVLFTVWCSSYSEANQIIRDFRNVLDGHVTEAGSPTIVLDEYEEGLYLIQNLDFYTFD